MYALAATAITPIVTEVGLSQLDHRCPAALPTGTRREAIPPAAAPSANGASTDDSADAMSMAFNSFALVVPERSAYAAPRTMIPIAAADRATARVEASDPKALG